MTDFVEVARASELPPGAMKRVKVDGRRVCLANVNGEFYALKDECGHQKSALSKGTLDGTVVECPLHFARFDVTTGKSISGPDFARLSIPGLDKLGPEAMEAIKRTGELLADVETEDVPAYEVRKDGDTILVRLSPDTGPAGSGSGD